MLKILVILAVFRVSSAYSDELIDVFIDLDGVLFFSYNIDEDKAPPDQLISIEFHHEEELHKDKLRLAHGAREFLSSLDLPHFRVSFWSGAVNARNLAALKATKLACGKSAYDLAVGGGRVRVFDTFDIIEHNERKDLEIIDGIDLNSAILIENSESVSKRSQKRNLLKVIDYEHLTPYPENLSSRSVANQAEFDAIKNELARVRGLLEMAREKSAENKTSIVGEQVRLQWATPLVSAHSDFPNLAPIATAKETYDKGLQLFTKLPQIVSPGGKKALDCLMGLALFAPFVF